jgi:mono/diheme cytochrome c family protein
MKRLIALVVLFGGVMGCAPPPEHDHSQLKSRGALYEFHCAECHGLDGRGSGESAAQGNLFSKRMPYIEMVGRITSRDELAHTDPMFDTMSRSEAKLIIDYVFELRKLNAGGERGQW